jgi:hypothetical protein
MTAIGLDRSLVDAYVSGGLDQAAETALAEQVAQVLPLHWTLPNPSVGALSALVRHLGGEAQLNAWLDEHPGRPRLVARTYRLVELLDRISDHPVVVSALAELRARNGEPAGLRGYLVPSTDSNTLASLAQLIESLLADDPTEALRLALSTVDLLEQLASRVAAPESELSGLGHELEQIRDGLTDRSVQDWAPR